MKMNTSLGTTVLHVCLCLHRGEMAYIYMHASVCRHQIRNHVQRLQHSHAQAFEKLNLTKLQIVNLTSIKGNNALI